MRRSPYSNIKKIDLWVRGVLATAAGLLVVIAE